MIKPQKQAFSILEISVAITIIALILGLITAASYLKKRVELTNIMDDIGKLNVAYGQFKTIYNELPGDMYDASTKFGANTTNGLLIQWGNGNGYIDVSSNNWEMVAALQHLSVAGLIPRNYTGSWLIQAGLGLNYMPGPYLQTGYYFGATNQAAGYGIFTGSTNNTIIAFAALVDANANSSYDWYSEDVYSALNSVDMLMLDNKYDDGIPNTGLLIATDGSDVTAKSCVNSTTSPYSYQASTTKACYFGVIIDKRFF